MANTYHNDSINQGDGPDFGMELALAIRALYSAANTAPGPSFKQILTRAASEIEAAKRTYGVRQKLARTAERMTQKTGGAA